MNDVIEVCDTMSYPEPILKTNQEKMIELLDVLTDSEIENLIKEIEDEKELRKLKKHRSEKLKASIRQEKAKLIKEMNVMKMKMMKNIELESEEEDDDEVVTSKKPVKKSKPVNRKSK